MNTLLTILSSLVIAVIIGAFGLLRKEVKKVLRTIELLTHKINALVYAVSKESRNGIMEYYYDYLNGRMKDDNFISGS